MGNMVTNVYAKSNSNRLHIIKALSIFQKLMTTTTLTAAIITVPIITITLLINIDNNNVKFSIPLNGTPMTELRDVTFHMGMGSHISATRHQWMRSTLTAGVYSMYLPRRDGRLSWPRWLGTYLDGLPVSCIVCDHWWQSKLVALGYHQGWPLVRVQLVCSIKLASPSE